MGADALLPRVYLEQDMSEAQSVPFAGGLAAVFSSRCPGKETVNEDAAALLPLDERRGVLVVADGLGGRPGGGSAAAIAVDCLRAAVTRAGAEDASLRAAILDGVEEANRKVLDLAIGAATTLAVVELDGPTLRSYHVGDSPTLVVGQRGKLKLETLVHSPVGYAVEAGLMDEHEAMHHEERHLVSNMVGAQDMRIEIGSPLALAPRDTVLMASDGLFDNLRTAEITDLVRKGRLDQAARALAQRAASRMKEPGRGHPSKPDDLTFIAFRPG